MKKYETYSKTYIDGKWYRIGGIGIVGDVPAITANYALFAFGGSMFCKMFGKGLQLANDQSLVRQIH